MKSAATVANTSKLEMTSSHDSLMDFGELSTTFTVRTTEVSKAAEVGVLILFLVTFIVFSNMFLLASLKYTRITAIALQTKNSALVSCTKRMVSMLDSLCTKTV